MKNNLIIKHSLFLVISITLLLSCKVENIDKPAPMLETEQLFIDEQYNIYDTVKLDYKLMKRYYFNVIDNGEVDLTLKVENFSSDLIKVAINGNVLTELNSSLKISKNKPLDIVVLFNEINKNSLQTAHFSLELEDAIGQKSEIYNIFISGFEKLPPISKFALKKINLISNFEYEIDATSSYDQDSKFGGKIVQYIYQIDNKVTLASQEGKLKYSFPGNGTYQVSVIVFDNDNLKGLCQKNIVIKNDGK